ncbi:methyl-accepting chemotaxis protein [Azospirillum thermophilum]|uniref:Methyl-accepting chemotaxis protein n=1 Tax=Azospirillum thermophilum TaxID=2202148 RepID=A0A2S2CML3_9PROT|nr:methyl-accepting chemotaxis protein [Azospirillum thermophilum]AWK85744.1 methyl-accepting chemotaxis protein [Azospirillum thermophilum]
MNFLHLISIRAKIFAVAVFVFCTVAIAFLLATQEMERQARTLETIARDADTVNRRVVPLGALVAELRHDSAQMRHWLTSLPALRGADAEKQAAGHAARFATHAEEAAKLARTLELPRVASAVEELRKALDPYQDAGRRLARAYAEGGPAAAGTAAEPFDRAAGAVEDGLERLGRLVAEASAERLSRFDSAIEEVRSSAQAMRGMLVGAGLTIMALASACVVFLQWAMLGPLERVRRTMVALAGGRLDVTVGFEGRHDEIGHIADSVRVFQRSALENERLRADQDSLRRQAEEERRQALAAMADKVEQEARVAVDHVAEHTGRMSGNAAEMARSSLLVSDNAQEVAAAAADALQNAQAVAAATEQLSASIGDIGAQVASATAVTGRAVDRSAAARRTIEQLSASVERIGAVARLIGDIASRTNLLALNATIEAARAGEAGRGFAVVAGEVKNLANQTAHSTEEIGSLIAEVQAVTSTAVGAVGEVSETIHEVSHISSTIAAAVEQQAAATQEIARSVTQTSEAAREVSSRIARVSGEADATRNRAGEVRQVAGDVAGSIDSLREVLVRVVRTATADVDRRRRPRFELSTPCLIEQPGRPPVKARLSNLSSGGAMLADVPEPEAPEPGTRAALRIEGISRTLACRLTSCEHGRVHLRFELSESEQQGFERDLAVLTRGLTPMRNAA